VIWASNAITEQLVCGSSELVLVAEQHLGVGDSAAGMPTRLLLAAGHCAG